MSDPPTGQMGDRVRTYVLGWRQTKRSSSPTISRVRLKISHSASCALHPSEYLRSRERPARREVASGLRNMGAVGKFLACLQERWPELRDQLPAALEVAEWRCLETGEFLFHEGDKWFVEAKEDNCS